MTRTCRAFCARAKLSGVTKTGRRSISIASRNVRSQVWIPQAQLVQDDTNDTHGLLIRAGYMRQAYAGIYHMLPLGLRVQMKLEGLIDKHMQNLSASKVSLSSLTSQSLWKKSDRWSKDGEFFRLKDRKSHEYFLAPTHEEEITQLVKSSVFAPSHLPVRVYQVSRKYRDEKRPRGGLLRGREFLMKDLYTFDSSLEMAHATYNQVRQAYRNIFDELKLPYIEARASSGAMGGKLSHEYHLPSYLGEDDIITCSTCDLSLNEEFVPDLHVTTPDLPNTSGSTVTTSSNCSLTSFFAKPNTLVRVISQDCDIEVNPFAVKAALDDLDLEAVEHPEQVFKDALEASSDHSHFRVMYLSDQSVEPAQIAQIVRQDQPQNVKLEVRQVTSSAGRNILRKHKTGESCQNCESAGRKGILTVQKAIEVGHTFHLGDRYSSKFGFKVPTSEQNVQMGCHGIGVSRLIAAAASVHSSGNRIMWPRAIAPYQVYIIPRDPTQLDAANHLSDKLAYHNIDALIDERSDRSIGWKFKDAEMIGSPVHVVIGESRGRVRDAEIQCPILNLKNESPNEYVDHEIVQLLNEL